MRRLLSRFSGRKLVFAIELRIHELSQLPLTSGVLFVKVKPPGAAAFTTASVQVRDNTAVWEEEGRFQAAMSVDSDTNVVNPCVVRLSVRQEAAGGGGFARLGIVSLDLADFVSSQEPTGRTYLLESSNVNSTLRVTVRATRLAGDAMYRSPAAAAAAAAGGASGDAPSPSPSQQQALDRLSGRLDSSLELDDGGPGTPTRRRSGADIVGAAAGVAASPSPDSFAGPRRRGSSGARARAQYATL